eukprot:scaffold264670_cov35-Attheya_sp.AAC.1
MKKNVSVIIRVHCERWIFIGGKVIVVTLKSSGLNKGIVQRVEFYFTSEKFIVREVRQDCLHIRVA